MSDAPASVWLTSFAKDQFGARLGRGTVSDTEHGEEYAKYIRADLAAEREQLLIGALEAIRDHELICEDPAEIASEALATHEHNEGES